MQKAVARDIQMHALGASPRRVEGGERFVLVRAENFVLERLAVLLRPVQGNAMVD